MMLKYIYLVWWLVKISIVIYSAYNWDTYDVCPVPISAAILVSNPSERIGISGV